MQKFVLTTNTTDCLQYSTRASKQCDHIREVLERGKIYPLEDSHVSCSFVQRAPGAILTPKWEGQRFRNQREKQKLKKKPDTLEANENIEVYITIRYSSLHDGGWYKPYFRRWYLPSSLLGFHTPTSRAAVQVQRGTKHTAPGPPTAAPWAGRWSRRREKQLKSFSEKQDSILTISSPPVRLQKCKPLMENMFSIKRLEKLSKKFVIISELSNLTTVSYQVWLAQSYTGLIKVFTYLLFLGVSSKWFKLSITNKDSEN